MKGASSRHVSKNEPQPNTDANVTTKPLSFQLSLIEDDSEIKVIESNAKTLNKPCVLQAVVEVPEIQLPQPNTNVDPMEHPSPELQSLHREISFDNADKFLTALMIVLTGTLAIMVLILLLMSLEHKW